MQHAQKALVFLILLVTPLLLAGAITPATYNGVQKTQTPVKISLPSYEDISPILIYNDFDMDNYASALSWDGDGSPATPYIIEGYSIVNDTNSIWIQDVTLSFEIRNCYISSETGVSDDGIFIENVTQAAIYDTVVVNKTHLINLWDTPDIYIENCTVSEGVWGIELYNCSGATIADCDIYFVTYDGIEIQISNNVLLSNNEITEISNGAGIKIDSSDHVTLLGNDISECSSSGVWAIDSLHLYAEDNIIHENWFFTGVMCGIHLDGSSYARIIDNDIYQNARNGIYLDNSDWVNITDNDIYCNSDHGIDAVNSIIVNVERNNIFSNG
ncbi:right-handed parallel beta-helix repeat-containing protein, partial [Candidatus Thorarchaeota archaeon]